MDRFDLYELTVQSPARLVPFLRAIHGREPRVLGEDFSGTDAESDAADVIFAGNFSIGEWHTRAGLVGYLHHARARLRSDGVFVCDTYGGASAFRTGAVERTHAAPDGALVRYTWEQQSADPLTAQVVNALHFRVERAGEIVHEITDAFVYRWRLWSVPELRDALAEAGFARTEVYSDLPDGTGGVDGRSLQPTDARQIAESFILCVIGRS